jgi:hypothetical protein
MLHLSSRSSLSKIRYQARKRGLKIRADGTGNFSVISIQTEPPRPLVGADHVPLWCVEQIVLAPLPERPPRRKRMARPVEPTPIVEEVAPVEAPVPAQAGHGQEPFRRLIELLQARGGRS